MDTLLPAAQAIKRHIQAASIGQVRIISGNFGTSRVPTIESNMFNPSLNGGALAHLGVYPISLAQWLFGNPSVISSIGTIGETSVDETVAFQLEYPQAVIGSFFVSLRSWSTDQFQILVVLESSKRLDLS